MTDRPYVIALTGSIGMGKSTVAGFFEDCGVAVWDADAAVHRLYAPDADGSQAIAALSPGVVGPDGVDRAKLSALIRSNPDLLDAVEAAIHPLVAADRANFLETCKVPIVLLDIPLLFETGADVPLDMIVVVSAAPEVQRARVLERPGMTEEKFDMILSRQLPDTEKRAQADRIIPTDVSLEETRQIVQDIVEEIREALG